MPRCPIVITTESKILAWIALRDDSVKKQLSILTADGFDWKSLYALARRHRMVPLLYHAIESNWIGQPPDALLSQISDETRIHWLQAANRSYDQRRILSSFESENISAIILKGTPLSYRLYDNFALRHSVDIDILIHPSDREKAASILYKQGFRLSDLHRTNASEWYIENILNGLDLIHPVKGTNVELMWRLHQQTVDPSADLFYSDTKSKTGPIYNLTPFDEAKDLLAHGGKHGWERMKWLTDLWRVWECYDVEWDKWQNEMEQYGLKPALDSALILHEWMIPEHPTPEKLQLKSNQSLRGNILAKWAIRQLSGNPVSPDVVNRDFIQKIKASLAKKVSFRPSYHLKRLRYGYINNTDIDCISLPRWAFPLYPFLKPVTRLMRLVKKNGESLSEHQNEPLLHSVEDHETETPLGSGDFQLFGMKVSSEIDLPLERIDGSQKADVTISFSHDIPDKENGNEWSVEVPATGTIALRDNHTILMSPAPSVSPVNLRLWLLGSTLGALCWRRGWLPMHATSVRFKDRVIMISGPSGVGKSTLAAACLAEGAELYTDDISPVYINNNGEAEMPGAGLRRLKLWPDAAERFRNNATLIGRVEKGLEKLEYRPPHIEDKPEKVHLLICLEDDPEVKTFGRLSGGDSLRAISDNLYYIDLMPESMKAPVMETIAELSRKIIVMRIKRPAGLDRVEMLAKQLASGGSGDEEI